jgi:hypothetical protein
MIKFSEDQINNILPFFSDKGIDIAFLMPTTTGLKKSIMDATESFRFFLKNNNIHNYQTQAQGPQNKITLHTALVQSDNQIETIASLYRPITKKGDPRIWFRELNRYCTAGDLLGVTTDGKVLYVFNLSSKSIINSLKNNGFAASILDRIKKSNQRIVEELLQRLNGIYRKGFVESVTRGDTGVGMTLEYFLDITPNSNKKPDFKGIEIKASRKKIGVPNRVNLFSQVPDWKNSNVKNAEDLLNQCGYIREGRLQLYCTVDTDPNSQGLFFLIDPDNDLLRNKIIKNGTTNDVVQWKMEVLRHRLAEKHPETFWVKADTRIHKGVENFNYTTVVHTKKPNLSILSELITSNIVTMDYTLSKSSNKIRDHGYLFKINPQNVNLLFPNPQTYQLI